jgi:hypothetical protein
LIARVERSLQDPDRVIETVGTADRYESLTAANSALAR